MKKQKVDSGIPRSNVLDIYNLSWAEGHETGGAIEPGPATGMKLTIENGKECRVRDIIITEDRGAASASNMNNVLVFLMLKIDDIFRENAGQSLFVGEDRHWLSPEETVKLATYLYKKTSKNADDPIDGADVSIQNYRTLMSLKNFVGERIYEILGEASARYLENEAGGALFTLLGGQATVAPSAGAETPPGLSVRSALSSFASAFMASSGVSAAQAPGESPRPAPAAAASVSGASVPSQRIPASVVGERPKSVYFGKVPESVPGGRHMPSGSRLSTVGEDEESAYPESANRQSSRRTDRSVSGQSPRYGPEKTTEAASREYSEFTRASGVERERPVYASETLKSTDREKYTLLGRIVAEAKFNSKKELYAYASKYLPNYRFARDVVGNLSQVRFESMFARDVIGACFREIEIGLDTLLANVNTNSDTQQKFLLAENAAQAFANEVKRFAFHGKLIAGGDAFSPFAPLDLSAELKMQIKQEITVPHLTCDSVLSPNLVSAKNRAWKLVSAYLTSLRKVHRGSEGFSEFDKYIERYSEIPDFRMVLLQSPTNPERGISVEFAMLVAVYMSEVGISMSGNETRHQIDERKTKIVSLEFALIDKLRQIGFINR